jgi:dihydroorotate dehydrogenase
MDHRFYIHAGYSNHGKTQKTTAKTTTTRGRKATPKTRATRTPKAMTVPHGTSANSPQGDAIIKMLKSTASTKKPPNNPDMPNNIIEMLNHDFNAIKEMLDSFSQHLRALDRRRLICRL